MIRGLYTAASGLTATMMESDVVANNLANVNTTGFKKTGVNYSTFGQFNDEPTGTHGAKKYWVRVQWRGGFHY